MATGTLPPFAPAFCRSTSLYTPERLSDPVLDHSTYSPFPTIPGSNHARDPYGLNAFLMHPTDALWDYMQPAAAPMPTPTIGATLSATTAPSVSLEVVSVDQKALAEELEVAQSPRLKKQMSLDHLRPIDSPSEVTKVVERDSRVTLVRRRSKSVGSPTIARKELDDPLTATKTIEDCRPPTKSQAARSFRSVLFKARKSLASSSVTSRDGSASTSPVVPEDVELPVVTYSPSSGTSDLSTTSSSSSSEGVRTPASVSSDHVSEPVTAIKLADALEEGVSRTRWLGWLGGKRGGNKGSKDSTPSSSRGSSPNASSLSLAKTPSPSRLTKPAAKEPISRVAPPPDRPKVYNWVGESLRRSTLRKAAALRRPSPHPLARQLARQGNLPQEVAMALRAEHGQRTFPKSVNSPSHSLTPAQGGLRTTLGLRSVLLALDAGRLPPGTFTTLPSPPNTRGKRGMRDFVDRRPFEDRMLVFYQGGKFSPISMARPGFGIWDLDFSAYTLALAALYDQETPSRTPRASYHSDAEGSASEKEVTEVEILVTPPPPEESTLQVPRIAEVSPSPATSSLPRQVELNAEEEVTPALAEISPTTPDAAGEDGSIVSSFKSFARPNPSTANGGRPLSSFRDPSKAKSATEWDDSDSDESDDDAAEDDKPLAMVLKRNSSMPALAPSANRSRPISKITAPQLQPHHLDDKRSSKRVSGMDQAKAIKQVALARQRREACANGTVERQAEASAIREKEAKRQSTAAPVGMPPKRASMSAGNLSHHSGSAGRPERTRSTFGSPNMGSRPRHIRTTTAPTSGMGSRRVQSVYDIPTYPAMGGHMRHHSAHSPHLSAVPAPGSAVSPNWGMGMYPHPAQNAAPTWYPAPPGVLYGGMVFQAPTPAYGLPTSHSRSSLPVRR